MKIVKGETLKVIYFYIRSRNLVTNETEPADLTDCTIEVRYRIDGGGLKTIALEIVGEPTLGIVKLESDDTTWDAAGLAEGRIYITNGSKLGITPGKFQMEVVNP